MNAKTDNNSLGLEVRKRNYKTTKKGYLETSMLLVTLTSSKHAAVTGNNLQNIVYNLLQLQFQAYGCYFYAFLLNKTVKIKSKFQAEERKHGIFKYSSSI